MSAENAWRIAMEAAALAARDLWRNGERQIESVPGHISILPMPPAFRAEAEAEAEEVRKALKRAIDNRECLIWRLEELCNNLGPGDEQYDLCEHVKECLAEDSALLSSLEAKGEEKP